MHPTGVHRMRKISTFSLFYLATFLQAGTYGLTFLLPRLFADFGANEKHVGLMLMVTTVTTLISVFYSGHLTDKLGRMASLGLSGFAIAAALVLFGTASSIGGQTISASALLGFGWGIFYTLGPVVLTSITDAASRVRYFSLLSVFMMAGFGLSPVLTSILETAAYSVSDAFKIMAVVCLVSGAIFLWLRPSIRALTHSGDENKKSSLTLSIVRQILASKARLPVFMVCMGASVFAGLNNFQTVFADDRGLRYADFFLAYTITVIVCRLLLVRFSGGKRPYAVIAGLQYIMGLSILVFMFSGGNQPLYVLVAVLFGIGYGASYPVLVAMAANDAEKTLVPQTLQLFALSYFIGIFAFPLIAGLLITEFSITPLLLLIAILAFAEASLAAWRART